MTRDYELGVILNPEVSEEQTRAILERIEQIIVNHDGQVVRVNQWGRRRLAYPIEHHRDGYYAFIDMILTPETVSELERTLKVSEIVLRHMVRKRDPKAVQQEREARAAAASAPPPPTPVTEETAANTGVPAQPETTEVTEAQQEQEASTAEVEQVGTPEVPETSEAPEAPEAPAEAPSETPVENPSVASDTERVEA